MEANQSKKMFVHVVQELRALIAEQKIKAGDKLPSERVLSETLQVSRSSIREALRSLELLGLIQSRHGGGTFLADSGGNQLVELIASFILQNEQSNREIILNRRMHEKEAIRVICQDEHLRANQIWESFFRQVELGEPVTRTALLRELVVAGGNRLSLKVWIQLNAYSQPVLKQEMETGEKEPVQHLLKSMQLGYVREAIDAYEAWLNRIEQA